MKWGGDDRESYKEFMIKWLGKKGFQELVDRSNEPANKLKKREWAKELYKKKLEELQISIGVLRR